MNKAQLQITIINAVIVSLSHIHYNTNITYEHIKNKTRSYSLHTVLYNHATFLFTFVSFRNIQQSNVVVNVFERASNVYFFIAKKLKIPTISEVVNPRGTCNTIAKKKKQNERQ